MRPPDKYVRMSDSEVATHVLNIQAANKDANNSVAALQEEFNNVIVRVSAVSPVEQEREDLLADSSLFIYRAASKWTPQGKRFSALLYYEVLHARTLLMQQRVTQHQHRDSSGKVVYSIAPRVFLGLDEAAILPAPDAPAKYCETLILRRAILDLPDRERDLVLLTLETGNQGAAGAQLGLKHSTANNVHKAAVSRLAYLFQSTKERLEDGNPREYTNEERLLDIQAGIVCYV